MGGVLREVLGGQDPHKRQQREGAFLKLACGPQATGQKPARPFLAAAVWEGNAWVELN